MTRVAPPHTAKAAPLAQQQVDFTAEGAPAPGTVAGHAPDTPAAALPATPGAGPERADSGAGKSARPGAR